MDANVEKNTTLNHIEGKVVSIPVIDKTLTKSDRSADAKVVGDEIKRLDGRLNEVDPHFAENVQYNNENSGLDATNMQNALDEINSKKSGRAYMYETEISKGDTGYCKFDITSYEQDRCIGIITICGNENKTSLAVVVWGKNYDCGLCDLVLGKSSDLEISREGNVFTVQKTSGGIWGADMSIIRVPSTF